MKKKPARDIEISITVGDTGIDGTLEGALAVVVRNFNTDTILDALSKALSRQARGEKDKTFRKYDLAEAKAVMELSDRITAGEIY